MDGNAASASSASFAAHDVIAVGGEGAPPPLSQQSPFECALFRLATVEIQLVLQLCDRTSKLAASRCCRLLLSASRSRFVWQHEPPLDVDLCNEAAMARSPPSSLCAFAGVHLTASHWLPASAFTAWPFVRSLRLQHVRDNGACTHWPMLLDWHRILSARALSSTLQSLDLSDFDADLSTLTLVAQFLPRLRTLLLGNVADEFEDSAAPLPLPASVRSLSVHPPRGHPAFLSVFKLGGQQPHGDSASHVSTSLTELHLNRDISSLHTLDARSLADCVAHLAFCPNLTLLSLTRCRLLFPRRRSDGGATAAPSTAVVVHPPIDFTQLSSLTELRLKKVFGVEQLLLQLPRIPTPLRQLVLDEYEWEADTERMRRFGASCACPAVLSALLDSLPSLHLTIHMPLRERSWMSGAWSGSNIDVNANRARRQRFVDLDHLQRQHRDRVLRFPLDRSPWH
jgi:hypothetical protein